MDMRRKMEPSRVQTKDPCTIWPLARLGRVSGQLDCRWGGYQHLCPTRDCSIRHHPRGKVMKPFVQVLLSTCFVLLIGCASAPPEISGGDIQVWTELPTTVDKEKVGDVITARDGNGCGLFGTKGTQERAVSQLMQMAENAHADAVLLIAYRPPHLAAGCRVNLYEVRAQLYRLPQYTYREPQKDAARTEFSHAVPASYDATWRSLIDAVSSDFYEISNYEKDSGLLTLSFAPDTADDYVDCGQWSRTYRSGPGNYSGTYLGWLDRSSGRSVNMRINLRVQPLSANSSRVEFNSLYTVNSAAADFKFMTRKPASRNLQNSPVTIDNRRVCQSTLKLENDLLTMIRRLASA